MARTRLFCVLMISTFTLIGLMRKRAVQQLRACGVLETIRISATWSFPLGGPGSFQIQGDPHGEVPAPLDKLT